MLFEKVKEEHIRQGIKDYEEKGLPNEFGASSTYDLVFENKTYPPKAIMAYANYHAEGRKIERYFKGGLGTDCFYAFERNGFSVIRKTDPITSMISRYKRHISTSKLEDEIYKWKLLSDYRGKPNLDSQNLLEELKSIDYNNLLYAMSKAVLKHLATAKPEEIRSLFKMLFDESIELKARIKRFNEETLTLYRGLGETLQHHQDERTIATYLTFNNPDKYTFYKFSFYKEYCKLLGVKQARKNEKYIHYLTVVNELIENYIKPDQELINQVKDYIPEYYDGQNHLLLAQDILYQMFEKTTATNYWIFQGNPKIYDITAALKAGHLKSWKVAAHKDKIQIGDQVILWQTSDNAGCYALAEVTSEVGVLEEEKIEQQYYKNPSDGKPADRVTIKILKNLVDDPILWEDIKDNPIFSGFKAGNQGTNFSATEKEYNELLQFENQQNSFFEVKAKFEETVFNNYIKNLKYFISELQIDINDERVVFSVRKDRLNFIIGQRYAFNLYLNEKRGFYGVISKEKLTENSAPFGGKDRDVLYTYFNDFQPTENQWKSIFNAMSLELKRTNKSGYTTHNNKDFQNYIFDMKEVKVNKETVQPINQILYGPPGTGKTFYLKEKLFDKYTLRENAITKEKFFENTILNLTWWQVIAIALIENGTSKVNDILENRWVKTKASLSESKNVRATIWGTLQMHTINSSENVAYKQRQNPLIFDKNNDKTWHLLEDEVKEQVPEIYDTINEINNFKSNDETVLKNYDFVTFHQSFAYEDFIEGIKPIFSENEEETTDLGYAVEDGVFKRLCLRAKNDPENRYAIFIDEINRGNVSAIFGELITLIETDKRSGAKNEINIKLPYSKKEFNVPSNLDIYGTMNTADRSIEALDTALRRRFTFLEIAPKPELFHNKYIESIDLEKLLSTINNRIELLIDKDHKIGHSYFLNIESLDSLKQAFKKSVIPLLEEYFFGDYGKIGLVLGSGFIQLKDDQEKVTFAKNFTEIYENAENLREKAIYTFTDENSWDSNSFISIYE